MFADDASEFVGLFRLGCRQMLRSSMLRSSNAKLTRVRGAHRAGAGDVGDLARLDAGLDRQPWRIFKQAHRSTHTTFKDALQNGTWTAPWKPVGKMSESSVRSAIFSMA